MDLNDYERHLFGLLCWSRHAATGPCNARQRQCPCCRKKWSYDRRRTQGELLKAFCLNATARLARRDYRTAYRAYMHLRLTLGEMTAEEKDARRPVATPANAPVCRAETSKTAAG